MVAGLLKGSRVAGKFKDFVPLLGQSAFGGLISGGFTGLATGNPLAGLTVGLVDTLGSATLATGLGTLGKRKILGKDINFAGGKQYVFKDTDDLDPLKKQLVNLGQAGTAARVGKAGQIDPQAMKALADYAKTKASYAPSGPQIAGMYATSIAAPFVVEPMFYPKPQGAIVSQQLNQRLGFDALSTNLSGNPMTVQGSSTDPRLVDGSIRTSDTEYPGGGYATGTLYQLAGNPMRGM
jgi:hypothetical protein|tara:strand:+ start:35 stop:745 length:711 start_codon:yes stop_codon:yes gene_type:complete